MTEESRIMPKRLIGSLEHGGWRMECALQGDTDLVEHGQELDTLARSGALYLDPEYSDFFLGYCLGPEQFNYSRYGSEVDLVIGSLNEFLALHQMESFGYLEVASSPTGAHELLAPMITGDIVEAFLGTLTNFVYDATTNPHGPITEMDIDTVDSQRVPVYDFYAGNMWANLQKIAGGHLGGSFRLIWFDRWGGLHFQPPPAWAEMEWESVAGLDKTNIRGKVEVIQHNVRLPVGQVILSAGSGYDVLYQSTYPTDAEEGEIFYSQRKFLAYSQTDADIHADSLYSWLKRPYTLRVEVDPGWLLPEYGLDLYTMVDVTYDGPAEDVISGAGVHLNLSAADFYVYGIEVDLAADRCWLTLESNFS